MKYIKHLTHEFFSWYDEVLQNIENFQSLLNILHQFYIIKRLTQNSIQTSITTSIRGSGHESSQFYSSSCGNSGNNPVMQCDAIKWKNSIELEIFYRISSKFTEMQPITVTLHCFLIIQTFSHWLINQLLPQIHYWNMNQF